MASAALHAQWENLKTSLGMTLVPVLVPFLRGLSSALNSMARFAADHPTLTQGLMLTGLALIRARHARRHADDRRGGAADYRPGGRKCFGLPLATAATGLAAFLPHLAALIALGTAVANADAIGGSNIVRRTGFRTAPSTPPAG